MRARLTRGRLAALGGAIVVVGAIAAFAQVMHERRIGAFDSGGTRARATVTGNDRWTERVTRAVRSTQHLLHVAIPGPDGRRIRGATSEYVSEARWEALEEGAEVEVIYLAATMFRDGDGWTANDVLLAEAISIVKRRRWWIYLGGVIALVGLVVVAIALRRKRAA